MNWFTYDIESYQYDFFVVFKNKETGEYFEFHNDNDGVKDFINEYGVYCGFNTKSFDQYIIKAIVAGFTPEEVKRLSDWLVENNDNQGWQYPDLKGVYYRFNNIDIRDDVQQGLSLKAIEGHLGLPIVECSVPFDIDRPLTENEIKEVFYYCRKDVDAAESLTNVRKDYLQTKLNLGVRAGLQQVESLGMTNAKLTAKMLHAVKKEWDDGRDYVYPPNLDLSSIPQEILDFFDTIHDKSISDEKLFKTFLIIDIGGMLCKFAWGGVHGSLTSYYEESTEDRVIQNRDVSSLYPSLIEEYDYLSRNVPDPQLFYSIRKERIEAKHTGNKQLAKDLKLPLNTVSGAQENKFNDLYDPLPTRSLRISGQLFLTMLTIRLLNACKTIKLLNLNTDGLMYSIDKSELPIVDTICTEWEKQTRFELEVDNIAKVWIKDVNNLLFINTDGDVKTVGGYLNYGISVKGAWSINNNMVIVKKALINYFTKDIPVEETINNSTNIFDFQIIAKAGTKFREAYHIVDGEKQPVQRVNRVYATKDTRFGKLVKIHAETDSHHNIESLPEHCIIDNDNNLSIDDIDKTFYIELAQKRVNDFLGIKPEKIRRNKKMATTNLNVYQKLIKARKLFLNKGASKSGKNIQLSYKYFELDDIIPIATPIFEEVGLLPIVSIIENNATMVIVNADKADETIVFTVPFKQIEPIISNQGKAVTNEMQALGSSITYIRRYLYMIALDICEADSIESTVVNVDSTPVVKNEPKPVVKQDSTPVVKPIKVATPKEEKPLTTASSNASELQIKQLKEALVKFRDGSKERDEVVAKIAMQTKSFTSISKADCEALIIDINNKINEVK